MRGSEGSPLQVQRNVPKGVNDRTIGRTPLPLVRLLRHLAPQRRLVITAVICSLLNKIFDLAPPALIGLAVDVVVRGQQSLLAEFGIQSVSQQLWVLALLTFVIWAAESLFEYLYDVLWRNLAQTTQHRLRLEAYNHLHPALIGDTTGNGTLSSLDASRIQQQVVGLPVNSFPDAVTL